MYLAPVDAFTIGGGGGTSYFGLTPAPAPSSGPSVPTLLTPEPTVPSVYVTNPSDPLGTGAAGPGGVATPGTAPVAPPSLWDSILGLTATAPASVPSLATSVGPVSAPSSGPTIPPVVWIIGAGLVLFLVWRHSHKRGSSE